MEPDKLLIVAHPDDDVLWGGMNLLLQPGWFVICASNGKHPLRSREFMKTMSFCNVTKWLIMDVSDKRYTESDAVADRIYSKTPSFEALLKKLSKQPWKVVLTHNEVGEYGHAHHRAVHRLTKKHFPSAKTFGVGKRLTDSQIEIKRQLLLFYKATQSICKYLFEYHDSWLREPEREHFFNEPIHVTPTREIPRVIHQIWFGKPLDTKSVRYHLMKSVEQVAKKNGYHYQLWTNEHLNESMLPLTWSSIQKAQEAGEELEQSRFAQVADLARYELLHRFGGVYLDSLFQIGDAFCTYIDKHRSFEIIVANEDPCGLKCKSGVGTYLSNGFFACVPGSMPLKRLVHPGTLVDIDFYNVRINQETGPYLFRKGIKPRDNVHVIDTEKIYPFMVNDSEYRSAEPNLCITDDDTVLHDCLTKKYPKSLAVYQSGFGGSWSW